MADPSGSGEPVPAPTCIYCDRTEDSCLCRAFKASSPGGEPPTPRATQEALEALRWLEHCATTPAPDDPDARGVRNAQIEDAFATVRAALGSARPPLPPQEISPEMVEAGAMSEPTLAELRGWLIEKRSHEVWLCGYSDDHDEVAFHGREIEILDGLLRILATQDAVPFPTPTKE